MQGLLHCLLCSRHSCIRCTAAGTCRHPGIKDEPVGKGAYDVCLWIIVSGCMCKCYRPMKTVKVRKRYWYVANQWHWSWEYCSMVILLLLNTAAQYHYHSMEINASQAAWKLYNRRKRNSVCHFCWACQSAMPSCVLGIMQLLCIIYLVL